MVLKKKKREKFLDICGLWSCVISCVGGWPQEPTSASAANEFGRKDNRVRRCRIIDDEKNNDGDEHFDLLFFRDREKGLKGWI